MSLETDGHLSLGSPEGSYSFKGDDSELRNLIRPAYTDSKGFVIGNTGGKAIIYSKDHTILHKFPIGDTSDTTIHDGTNTYSYSAFDHISFETLVYSNYVFQSQSVYPQSCPEGTKMRIEAVHTATGNLIYQNCTDYEFHNDGAGLEITEGIENTCPYDPYLPLVLGETYTFSIEFSEDVVLYGDDTSVKQMFTTQPIEIHEVSCFDKFESTSTYNIGDRIWYNDSLYFCNTDEVTGDWDETQWNNLLTAAHILEIQTKTGDYTMTEDDYTILMDASSSSVTINLPSTPHQGQVFMVKCIDKTNPCVLSGNGNKIDNSLSDITLVLKQSIGVQWDDIYEWARII